MDPDDPRAALDALIVTSGIGYAALSRMLRRNDAYLQQYVKRGTPRLLAERDRKTLAAFFRVDEAVLGGGDKSVSLPALRRLDMAASAGPGALADDDRTAGSLIIDPRVLASFGVDERNAAFLPAAGDSMEPTICDGDMMLIDERDREVGARGGIYVLRRDGALIVKRLSREDGTIVIASDNAAYPPVAVPRGEGIEIVGRVVWLSRSLR